MANRWGNNGPSHVTELAFQNWAVTGWWWLKRQWGGRTPTPQLPSSRLLPQSQLPLRMSYDTSLPTYKSLLLILP